MSEQKAQAAVSFTPHRFQQLVLDAQPRFLAVVTGAQAGKTTVGAVWMLREIYESFSRGERVDWLIAAPTVKILHQSTLPKFREFFGPLDWGEYKENKQEYQLKWGNRIYVRSTEDPDSLEGMTIKAGWFDEAGQMKYQAWINLQARLAIQQGRALLTTTPYACNWLQSDIYRKAATLNGKPTINPDPDNTIAVFNWSSKDNPAFSKEEYERAKKSMSAEMFERRYEGKFTRLEGLVYRDFEPDRDVVRPFPIPTSWKRFCGLDFGQNHATVALCLALEPEEKDEAGKVVKPSTFYAYREFYHKQPLLRQVADFILGEDVKYTLADPRGAQERAELSRVYGVRNLQTADNDIEVGIERIKALFKEGRLKIFANCKNTIDELGSYHYALTSIDRPSQDHPVKANDDCMDALRYALSRSFQDIYPNRPNNPIYQLRTITRRHGLPRRSTLPPPNPFTGY